jgi:hypothetical protein
MLDGAAARAAEEYQRAKVREKVKRTARAALSKLPSRMDILIYAFLLCLALWLGAVKLPEISRTEPPMLGLADLQGSGIFTGIDPKPPSLFVEVDPEAWFGIDPGKRLTLIEMTGNVLEAKGYSGALFRTGRRRPLAQWLKARGAILIESDEAASTGLPPGGPDATFSP